MPNWIMNRLVVDKREDEIAKYILNDKGNVDFNNIVPMPESLNISKSSDVDYALEYLDRLKKNESESSDRMKCIKNKLGAGMEVAIKEAKQHLGNVEKYGFGDWYEWSCANWGTKWNACETRRPEPNIFMFETAWSPVIDLVAKIANKFPDVRIEYCWADEDTGSNTGFITFSDGEEYNELYEDGSDEAYELAFELRPELKEMYIHTDEGYEYSEECDD